jgi:hypothetical protein
MTGRLDEEPRRWKRRGSNSDDLRQVISNKLVLTCHGVVILSSRTAKNGWRRRRSAARQRVCAGSGCHTVFWLCPHCTADPLLQPGMPRSLGGHLTAFSCHGGPFLFSGWICRKWAFACDANGAARSALPGLN